MANLQPFGSTTFVREIVYDGINGHLTESEDTYTIGQSVIKILKDSYITTSVGRVSRTLAEGYVQGETFDRNERIYHQMVIWKGLQKLPETYGHISVETNQGEMYFGTP